MNWHKVVKTVRQPEDLKDEKICALCAKPYSGFGNNGKPLVDGRVCDNCNRFVVLYRLKLVQEKDMPKMRSPEFFDSSWQNNLRRDEV
tara:strand:+ start:1232 stop:1495 length:264 start_codon:yes stop_codon:yes gene_type:complete